MVTSLRSQFSGLCFFTLALITQLNHAQYVGYYISHKSTLDWWSSWGAAFTLETAVLYAVVNGKKYFSYLFAAISILINVAYYEFGMVEGSSMRFASQLSEHWPMWLYSVIVPVGLAFYSHVFGGRQEDESAPTFVWMKSIVGKVRSKINIERTPELTVQKYQKPIETIETQEYPVQVMPMDLSEKHQEIVRFLSENGTATAPKISESTGIAPMTLRRKDKEGNTRGYLEDLVQNHLIVGTKNGKAIEYSLNGEH